ncbi:MAG: hypothetical protein HOQ09_07625 [Gemmatimonadaceae bacterium]|nr:hypothetical protein [Gemmatimonadaceae bacterium]
MNHRSSVAMAAALVALTACASTVDVPPLRPFAFLDLNTLTASARPSGFVAKGTALFTQARITGVIGSGSLPEGCQQPAKIVPLSVRTTSPFEPGSVTLSLHGNVDTTTRTVPLLEKQTTQGEAYWTNDSLPNFAPGSDTVTFKAAGNPGGFPPFSVRAATVQTFTPQPVDDSVTGTGIRVQWTPSPNPSTAMQISLQYTDSASTTGYPNMEIVCIARDDGDFTINRTFLEPWERAGVDSLHVHRGVAFSRFLTTTSQVGDGFVTVVVRRDTTIVKE